MRPQQFILTAALTGTAWAQLTQPQLSAKELAEGLVVITDAVGDAAEILTGLTRDSQEGVQPLVQEIRNSYRASSVASQALPPTRDGETEPKEEDKYRYPSGEQPQVCDGVEKLYNAALNLAHELNDKAGTAPVPRIWKPIGREATFLESSLEKLLDRSASTANECGRVGDQQLNELHDAFFEGIPKYIN